MTARARTAWRPRDARLGQTITVTPIDPAEAPQRWTVVESPYTRGNYTAATFGLGDGTVTTVDDREFAPYFHPVVVIVDGPLDPEDLVSGSWYRIPVTGSVFKFLGWMREPYGNTALIRWYEARNVTTRKRRELAAMEIVEIPEHELQTT